MSAASPIALEAFSQELSSIEIYLKIEIFKFKFLQFALKFRIF